MKEWQCKMKKGLKISYFSRFCYSILGWTMVVLGIIGVILPIMPAVPFLLVASWCFSRSSPRFHNWLHNHQFLGPFIKQWEENRVIPLPIKIFAITGMIGGFFLFLVIVHPVLWLILPAVSILLAVAFYIMTRPSSSLPESKID